MTCVFDQIRHGTFKEDFGGKSTGNTICTRVRFFFAILEKPLLHQFILLEKNTTLELSIIALNMETKWMSSAFLMALLSLNAVIQGKIHL